MEKKMYLYKNRRIGKSTRLTMRVYAKKCPSLAGYAVFLRLRCEEFMYGLTFCHIMPEAWDIENQSFREGMRDVKGRPLSDWEEKLDEIYCSLDSYLSELPNSKRISEDYVKSVVLPVLGRTVTGPNISADYQQYIIERARSKRWRDGTLAQERRVYKLFIEYTKNKSYQDITLPFMESFAISLKGKLRDENLKKTISSVGGFLDWARKHGRPVPDGRYVYRYKKPYSPIIYLSKSELVRIISFDVPPSGTVVRLRNMHGRPYEKVVEGSETMKLVKDMLLFGCLTGLRWSEIQYITHEHIHDGVLSFVTIKTDTPRVVNLNRFALAIIEKYCSVSTDGHVFPRLSNQKANLRLHDLAELCGINEPVTEMLFDNGTKRERVTSKYEHVSTHTGRKTFVCQALLAGLTPELVTLWTGHASVDDMRPYIAATGEAQAQNMTVMYDSIFEKKGDVCHAG